MEILARKHVEKIAIENGFKNYSISTESGSDLGFIGVLKKFIIVEDERKLSLMCKFLPEDKEQNERFNSFTLYEREVVAYQKVLAEFEKLQLENGFEYRDSNGFWSNPRCYYSHFDRENPTKSIIIMEDLTVENFIVKSKFISSDFNHTRKLFIELAKLHALSFVLRARKPKILESFKQMRNNMYSVMTTESMKHLAPRNIELAGKLFEKEEVRDKILSFKSDLWERVRDNVDSEFIEPYSVICHGDAWINNVLYNYNSANDIKDIRLVDWQMTYYGSGCTELTLYLFCCMDKLNRGNCQIDLLNTYYASMEVFLNKFSIKIDKVYPFEIYQEHLRKFLLFGFAMSTFTTPLLCKYPEKLFDDKNADLTDDERQNLNSYNERMRDSILDMIDMEII